MNLKMMKQSKQALAHYNKAVLRSVLVLLACGVLGTKAGAIPDVPAQYIVTPQQFGAKADGVTDDTDAIQKVINTVFTRRGGIVFFPRGVHALGKPPVTHDIRGNNPNSQIHIPTREVAKLKEDGAGIANLDEHNSQRGISLLSKSTGPMGDAERTST